MQVLRMLPRDMRLLPCRNHGQRKVELLFRAHHRIEVFDRRHICVLGRCRARDRYQGFARRIGYQVEMEITGLGHLYSSRTVCG